MTEINTTSLNRPRHKWNVPLIVGSIIVLIILLLAIFGEQIAPQDPMQENYSLRTSTGIHSPPYRLFEVPGYPLGTDNFGRDNLSRILAGIRPTLNLVLIVAAARILIGLTIGMLAGWKSGSIARSLEKLISISLSLPVLIVAVIYISAVGSQKGLWVFLVGLSLNGWAETALLVSDKTRQIKDQTYIEVARSLGASDRRILFTHVLRQVLPMIWMLIAYEISSTLLVTSELGFLGYYIGGGVWIAIFDFQTVNTTGLPELGQILATSLYRLTEPTTLLVTGFFIFLTILGFNYLGDGLRRELTIHHTIRMVTNPLFVRIGNWLEWKLFNSFEIWFKDRKVRIGLVVVTVLMISVFVLMNFSPNALQLPGNSQIVAGENPWSAQHGNGQGTRFVPFEGPKEGSILWQMKLESEFLGGPVVSADGTIYVVGTSATLYAIDPQGSLIWQTDLPIAPVGSPALGSEGQIYVVDQLGGLSAFTPGGELLWHYSPDSGKTGTSGPVVSRDGSIFYFRVSYIQAVSSSGEPLWVSKIPDNIIDNPPRLNPAETHVITRNAIVAIDDGASMDVDFFTQLDPVNFYTDPTFFIGADGNTYYRIGHGAIPWDLVDNNFITGEKTSWDARNPESAFPFDAGVNGHSLLWMSYGDYRGLREMVWLDLLSGNTYGFNSFIYQSSNLIGMDIEDVTYLCGYRRTPQCLAFKPGQETPVWETSMPEGQAQPNELFFQIWGALAPDRLYITTRDGFLYGLGDPTTVLP